MTESKRENRGALAGSAVGGALLLVGSGESAATQGGVNRSISTHQPGRCGEVHLRRHLRDLRGDVLAGRRSAQHHLIEGRGEEAALARVRRSAVCGVGAQRV